HNADPLHRWLVVIERPQILSRDQAVTLRIFLPPRFKHRPNFRPPLLQSSRKNIKFKIMFLAPPPELNSLLGRFCPPALGKFQSQLSLSSTRYITAYADFDCGMLAIARRNHLRPRLQFHRKRRNHGQASLFLDAL